MKCFLAVYIVKGPKTLMPKDEAAKWFDGELDNFPKDMDVSEVPADTITYQDRCEEWVLWERKDFLSWLDKFYDFWACPSDSLDTDCKTDPDDDSKVIVVAGETCHSDTPDGEGYQLLETAIYSGFAKFAGIL